MMARNGAQDDRIEPPAATTPFRIFDRLERAAAAAMILGSFAWLLLTTWGTWCDPLVDFGQQPYFAWRITEGDVLYRDLAYYNGPLSMYVNALAFWLFGRGLIVLVLTNLLLLAALLATVYGMFRQIGSRWGSAIVCVMFLWLFAFARFTPLANYNYVCPYCYEATHGLMLALWGLGLLWLLNRFGMFAAVTSGLAFGLCFLTKAEVSLPALGAATVSWATLLFHAPSLRRRAPSLLGSFGAALLVPPLIAFAALASAMPWRQAGLGTVGSWALLFCPTIRQLKFFQNSMGTSNVLGNLGMLLAATACWVVIVALLGLVTWASRRLPLLWRLAIAIVAAGLISALLWMRWWYWGKASCALPALLTLLLAGTVWEYYRAGTTPRQRLVLVRRLSLLVFAGLLLGKMILNVRVEHYGFVLAMPAFLLMIAALWDFLPQALFPLSSDRAVFRAAVIPFVASWLYYAWFMQHAILAAPAIQVASGRDTFYSNRREADAFHAVIPIIEQTTSPKDTVWVFPEGVMLNYLTRRRSIVPYVKAMPAEILFFGEDKILDALKASPPRLVVWMPQNTAEFGVTLGQDFLARTMEWLDSHYRRWYLATDRQGRYTITVFAAPGSPPPNEKFWSDDPQSQLNRSRLLARTGEFRKAIEHGSRSLQLKPDDPQANDFVARLLATHEPAEGGDPARAVKLAEHACELTHRRNVQCLDTLAAAYASAGRFREAADIAQEACRIIQALGQGPLADIQRRLQLYRNGKPYREPSMKPANGRR
jgi:tetratricopeptide (TPR) repeat protein